jgi:hypothetical protein
MISDTSWFDALARNVWLNCAEIVSSGTFVQQRKLQLREKTSSLSL